MSYQEASPPRVLVILFPSIQFTCYFISELPDAIMIPSGILAKVTAVCLLQSLWLLLLKLAARTVYLDCLHKCCIPSSSLQQGFSTGSMLITRGFSRYIGSG